MATPAQITALIAQGDWSNAPGAISPMQLRGILNAIAQSMITGDSATINAVLGTWWGTLPTSLPGTAGTFWNNGGTLART